MNLRTVAVLAVLGSTGATASAQPAAPAPRPTFTSYYSQLRSAGLVGQGWGTAYGQEVPPPAWEAPPGVTTPGLAGRPPVFTTGPDPSRPAGGRGTRAAVFNDLGHWYPPPGARTPQRPAVGTLRR